MSAYLLCVATERTAALSANLQTLNGLLMGGAHNVATPEGLLQTQQRFLVGVFAAAEPVDDVQAVASEIPL